MIFGNIRDWTSYEWLEKGIRECFAYARDHDLAAYEKGSHPIDGDRLFVNIVEYKTTVPKERFWEAHREYLDLHLMLSGREKINLNFIENLEQKEYVPKDDFLALEGKENSHVVLEAGDFLVCYPKDGHMTALQEEQPEDIKKAIFKIKI